MGGVVERGDLQSGEGDREWHKSQAWSSPIRSSGLLPPVNGNHTKTYISTLKLTFFTIYI